MSWGFNSSKCRPNISSIMEPPQKRMRLESTEDGRKKWLREIRAICDRRSTMVVIADGGRGQHSGLELFRFFLIDVFSESGGRKLYPLKEMECRHQLPSFRPVGVTPCLTGGTKDKGKAQGFVLSDLKKHLRAWLAERTMGENLEAGLSDGESDSEDDTIDVKASQVTAGSSSRTSSWDPVKYPSSQPVEGKARKSTKGRLMVLSYLNHHAHSADAFREAFKALTTSDAALLHLCGCGLSGTNAPACVTGSHLKLASLELNREHTHLHFVLRLASESSEKYQAMLGALCGCKDSLFDDVF